MAHAAILFLGLFISGLSTGAEAAPSSTDEHESCKIWDRLARQVTTSTGAQQVCTSSGNPCTRIDCNGAYQYNSENTGSFFNLGGKTIEVDYCFGVILNHCDKNISLDFYMQVPNRGVDQTTRVFHNTLLSIPGLSYSSNSTSGISAQGYLYFQMERWADTVTFSVTLKVRMRFAGMVYWPDELQRRLIRDETVPVPPCDPGSGNATSAIPTIAECKPPHWKKSPVGQSPGSGDTDSGDFGRLCNKTQSCSRDPWLACDHRTNRCVCAPDFEKVPEKKKGGSWCRPKIRHGLPCRSDDDCSLAMSERCFQGRCDCQENDVFNSQMQTCEPKQTGRWPGSKNWATPATGMPHIAPDPTKSPAKKTGQSKAAIIAGAVVGGLVVLGGLLLAAYFAIRRLRRPYHHRELLLEGEDSDGIM
ncbi:uncharacterized protein LOC143278060 [Babylonia areolata]|uniref:uncharacterized protein LOC143278060 n=1 Tax=Babylonia areolata TaxID=304850 RepID=UPI003FD1E87B